MNSNKKGVSVIICCYNSAQRISNALVALAKQQYPATLLWEIIIVDNACTDNTGQIACEIWETFNTDIALRVVYEPLPGLGHARIKGVNEAMHPIVLFCDDDNWLAENYVQGVCEILEGDCNIAACGGMGIPVFETPEPYWFYQYAEAFALGSQEINSENGQLLNLYGAGMAVQKHILKKLYQSSFDPLMKGRSGKQLSSSEDTELTYAFVLMGYKLFYAPDLKFFHYMPKERLTFEYLKKLFISFGNDGPFRNLYYAFISKRFLHKHMKNWGIHLLISTVRLVKYFILPPKKYGRAIYFNWNVAYIRQLVAIRKNYPKLKKHINRIREINSHAGIQNISQKGTLSFEQN